MVHDCGFIESGMTASFDMLTLADEVISMVRRICNGIQIGKEKIALDIIAQVGHDGDFVSELHTLQNFRKEQWQPNFQKFSDRIHKHGSALMCQITHLGRRGKADEGYWLPTIAPSRVRESKYRSFPKEMDEDDIARVVRAFGEAARRCKEGFLDGIEVFCGGHLVGQFFSLLTNKRDDRFGGAVTSSGSLIGGKPSWSIYA
jgi:2,4-dienoyl-CoA reductase-like NADH-dependent reductase (Old Yellow Enzyme family)